MGRRRLLLGVSLPSGSAAHPSRDTYYIHTNPQVPTPRTALPAAGRGGVDAAGGELGDVERDRVVQVHEALGVVGWWWVCGSRWLVRVWDRSVADGVVGARVKLVDLVGWSPIGSAD